MKRIYISVPSKLLFLIIMVLMLIGSGYSWLSLSRLEGEFKQHQVEMLKQAEQQFELHSNQLKNQITVWLESLADSNKLQDIGDFSNFGELLNKQFLGVQLHLNVENIWLLSDNNLVFSTTELPDYVKKNSAKVILEQAPVEEIICRETCLQVLSLPLLNNNNELAVVTVSVSLIEMLYNINNVLKSEVSIIKLPNKNNFSLLNAVILSTSSEKNIQRLLMLNNKQTHITFEQLAANGEFFSNQSEYLLANFFKLAQSNDYIYSLVAIANVTKLKAENTKYRHQFLGSVLVIFFAVAILIYLIIKPFTSRLLILSKALPKLAKREFVQFREIDVNKKSFFSDEFECLAQATNTLSLELEQLNLEVEQKTKELENIAMYDLLTGLPNRNMLNYVLKKQVEKQTYSNNKIAIMFLDLDDFKKVNDSNGHSEGDKLLIEAAHRIRSSIKNIDLACRFGGDEFVIVLNQVSVVSDVIEIAKTILDAFRQPIKINQSIFYITTSIGIVISDDPKAKADDLISYADIAMYEAKGRGGAQYHIYHTDMFQRVAHRVFMEGEVRQALLKQQFTLSLQPQIAAKDNRLYGFEALLRWRHPERGMISPDDFIPILENSEHMIELGYWVVNRCFEIMTVLKALGYHHLKLAINFSAGQFLDPELSAFLIRLLNKYKLSASCFELELTEQTLVNDIDKTIAVMDELKKLGFSFAIDDFGTGYSSLAYLKRMPVDVIKIDKSFVSGMLENKSDHQIIMSTIAMVKSLELNVVAEGVESSAQLRSLAENGCDVIQGYYFSKPIPDVEIYDFIANNFDKGVWKLTNIITAVK